MTTTKAKTAIEKFIAKPIRRCVFCEKSEREVAMLVESMTTGGRICDECVSLCNEIFARHAAPR